MIPLIFRHRGVTYDLSGDYALCPRTGDVYSLRHAAPKRLKPDSQGRVLNSVVKINVARMYLSTTQPHEDSEESAVVYADGNPWNWKPTNISWETPDMRRDLAASNQRRLEALPPDSWRPIRFRRYSAGGYEDIDYTGTYEIDEKTAAVRRLRDEAVVKVNSNGQVALSKRLFRIWHVYLGVFHPEKQSDVRREVDHIDGDHTNNAPWNWRWICRSHNMENVPKRRRVQTLREYDGTAERLLEFQGWKFGERRVDGRMRGVVVRPDGKEVLGWRVDSRNPRPRVIIRGKAYALNRVMAHLFCGLSDVNDGGAKVTHWDGDPANFAPSNVRVGRRDGALASGKNPRARLGVSGSSM